MTASCVSSSWCWKSPWVFLAAIFVNKEKLQPCLPTVLTWRCALELWERVVRRALFLSQDRASFTLRPDNYPNNHQIHAEHTHLRTHTHAHARTHARSSTCCWPLYKQKPTFLHERGKSHSFFFRITRIRLLVVVVVVAVQLQCARQLCSKLALTLASNAKARPVSSSIE